jgi:DNA mismatch repair protein MutL
MVRGQTVQELETPLLATSMGQPTADNRCEASSGTQMALPGYAPSMSFYHEGPITAALEALPAAADFAVLPVLGQMACSYILLDAPDGLIIIDQHAAHERILFERLMNAATSVPEARQLLTRTMVLEFLPKQAAVLRDCLAGLGEAGFEIEPFGGESFAIHAVPAVLGDCQPALLLRDLVETAMEGEVISRPQLLAALAKAAACRQALKARHKLNREEIGQLLKELDETLVSSTCPHGRPLWWKLTHTEIARFFQRSQAPGTTRPS